MNRCNDRLRYGVQPLDDTLHLVLISNPVRACKPLKLRNIRTGRKGLAISTHDDNANRFINCQVLKVCIYLLVHRPRQCIKRGRSRQRHYRNCSLTLQQHYTFLLFVSALFC